MIIGMDIKRQITINSAGSFVLMFAQWLISVLLVRMGGFADAGVFSLAMTIANVFGAIANCGVRSYQVSDAGNQFAQKQYLWTRICTVAISFLICCLYFLADRSYSQYNRWAILLYLIYINANMISDVMYGSLQLNGRLELNGYSSIIKGGCCLAAFLLSYAIWRSLLLSLLLMAATDIGVIVAYDIQNYMQLERRQETADVQFDFTVIGRMIRICFPLMLNSLLAYVITAAPRRTIQSSLGEEFLGYYSSLFTPTVVITTLMPTIVLGVMPSIALHWQHGEKKLFIRQVIVCFAIITGFTLLAMLGALAAGRPVMKLLFGSEIMPYFGLLYVAIIVSGLNALRSCCDSVMICMRKTKAVIAAAVVELLVVLAIADVFVLRWGIEGAAVVMLIGYSVHFLIQSGIIIRGCKMYFTA